MRWHGRAGLSLHQLNKGITGEMKDQWRDVQVLIVDEISLVTPRLFGALSYRTCLARRDSLVGIQPDLYMEPGHVFGAVPLVILAGDFMQLAPFETKQRVSLLRRGQTFSADEHLNGLACFHSGVTDVFFLRKTFRFRDPQTGVECPYLPGLFEYMRDPRGLEMPDELWSKLQSQVVRGPGDERLEAARGRGAYEMAIQWEAVARLMQYRARREAQEDGQIMMYVQAIDVPHKVVLSRDEYRRALLKVNMTSTGNRLGMLPVFVGMRVRLTAKLSAKRRIMQDSVGTVVGVEFHPDEFRCHDAWNMDAQHEVYERGYVRLRYMPQCVYVRFDGYEEDFGFGAGVVNVLPSSSNWEFHTHDNNEARSRRVVAMSRVQVPLAPEKVRTVQTAQGMSMDAAIIMLNRQGNMSNEDWWLHVYVMLSRVRTIDQMFLFGLPEKSFFRSGPPGWIAEGLRHLEAMATRNRGRVVAWRLRAQPWAGQRR
jgi:hypothetical protein